MINNMIKIVLFIAVSNLLILGLTSDLTKEITVDKMVIRQVEEDDPEYYHVRLYNISRSISPFNRYQLVDSFYVVGEKPPTHDKPVVKKYAKVFLFYHKSLKREVLIKYTGRILIFEG